MGLPLAEGIHEARVVACDFRSDGVGIVCGGNFRGVVMSWLRQPGQCLHGIPYWVGGQFKRQAVRASRFSLFLEREGVSACRMEGDGQGGIDQHFVVEDGQVMLFSVAEIAALGSDAAGKHVKFLRHFQDEIERHAASGFCAEVRVL